MKNISLLFLLMALTISANAQATSEKYVFTTGGSPSIPQNFVKLAEIDIETGEMTVLDSVLGDFSKAIAVKNQYAYWHVGRAMGNSLGQDLVIQYDLVNRERIDSITGLGGLNSLTIKDQYIISTHDSDAAGFNRIRIYERNDLTTPFYQNSIQGEDVYGTAVIDDFIFNGYTKNNVGHIAITTLDDFGIVVEDLVAIDTLSAGISDLFAKDGLLYIVSNKFNVDFEVEYAAVTRFDYTDYTYSLYESEGVFTPIGIIDIALVAIFAEGFNYLDINELSPIASTSLPFYAAGSYDDLNDKFYLQQTDFGSFGNVSVVDTSGQVVNSYSTAVGGQACAMAYNNVPEVPEFINHNTAQTSDLYVFSYPLPLLDIDGDTLSYSIIDIEDSEVEVDSIVGNIIYGELLIMQSQITLEVMDPWGAKDMLLFQVGFPLDTEELSGEVSIAVYPNPTAEELNVELNAPNRANYTIVNIFGRTLGNGNFNEKTSLNIAHLPKGTYWLILEIDGATTYRKVLKL